ncbi:hypothetical protein [Salarchaeum sp. JOR-1]|uniref:hypothetical protein n=1 Tax=Salarchaeum sp. JOR-1 TaxID=2599399 RepID=UPI001198AC04|nr:hypothetical protein [Salarchaeum sp. JOR-1]QDX40581.1 hypothetical protein FQU85_06580 [Salarchaeum sp. JOR-1]
MPPSKPFFTPDGELDLPRVLVEVVPLAKLVVAVGVTAAIPAVLQYLLVELVAVTPLFIVPLSLVTQFVLAVGTAFVLLYVVARANQLANA